MRLSTLAVCAAACALATGCSWLDDRPAAAAPAAYSAGAQAASPLFTPARSSLATATNDYLGIRPRAQQPIEFPHKTHIEKGLTCTEACHESVTKGPVAGLPSVNTCLICHAAIATDRPLIQQITALQEKGLDLDWQRVYGYSPQAHVKFNHAPHIRAKVECSTCHGDIASQTVAQRNVDLHMGFCVNCHREKQAPNDCLTCHY